MAFGKKILTEFEIDYSKAKDVPAGGFIESHSILVGGYKWALRFCPREKEMIGGYVSGLYLILLSEARKVPVEFHLGVQLGTYNTSWAYSKHTATFSSQGDRWGNDNIPIKNTREGNHSCSTIRVSCKIEILSEPKSEFLKGGLHDHNKELLESKKRSDVTFEVEGKTLTAHRLILATRSPVFEAELFGAMSEGAAGNIEIKDMRADVFEALLHFIYTDEVSGNCLTEDLLLAADRYALEKLKEMCEERLSVDLSIESAISALVLADRHSCAYLKEKCLDNQ